MGRDILAAWGEGMRVGVRICIDTGAMRPREVDELGSRGAMMIADVRWGFRFKAKHTRFKPNKVGELIDQKCSRNDIRFLIVYYCVFFAPWVFGTSKGGIFNELTTLTATRRTGTNTTAAINLELEKFYHRLTPCKLQA